MEKFVSNSDNVAQVALQVDPPLEESVHKPRTRQDSNESTVFSEMYVTDFLRDAEGSQLSRIPSFETLRRVRDDKNALSILSNATSSVAPSTSVPPGTPSQTRLSHEQETPEKQAFTPSSEQDSKKGG